MTLQIQIYLFLGAIVIAFGLGITLEYKISRHSIEVAISDQKAADILKCNADKKLTNEVSQNYENQIFALNKRIGDLLRKPARCVIAKSAGHSDAAPVTGANAGTYGISSEWLYQFAGEGERYRLQVIGLQDFINRVWQTNNQ